MKKKIDKLSKMLNNLEAKVTEIENGTVEKEHDMKVVSWDCLVELKERISQKKCLVLLGLLETVNTDQTSDRQKIESLFSALSSLVLLKTKC